MKIGIFNASDYTLAEAIQQNAINWVNTQCGIDVASSIIAPIVYACANHDIGFVQNDIVKIFSSKGGLNSDTTNT